MGDTTLPEEPEKPVTYEDEKIALEPALKDLLEKIRIYVFKHRIRTYEFFWDNDKLRKGVVSRNQFVRGLLNISPNLQENEINLIAAHCSNEGIFKNFLKNENTYENFLNWSL